MYSTQMRNIQQISHYNDVTFMFTATPAKWYRENRRDWTESGGCCGPIWSDESLRRHVLAVRSENSSGPISVFFFSSLWHVYFQRFQNWIYDRCWWRSLIFTTRKLAGIWPAPFPSSFRSTSCPLSTRTTPSHRRRSLTKTWPGYTQPSRSFTFNYFYY